MTDPNARIGAYADATGIELPDGTDTFQHLQKPDLRSGGDPLVAFVIARIIDLETEPRQEFPRVYALAAGPIAHRYAKHVRDDCVVFRQIVAAYLKALAITEGPDAQQARIEAAALRRAVMAIAERWWHHPTFRDDWG